MGYNDCTSGSNRSLCLLRFSKRVTQIESRRWHRLGVPTTSQQPCVLRRKRIISQSDHGACPEALRVPIPTHRHLDYSRVQRKVAGNTWLATHLCSDWKLICAIHHGVSLHSKWTESREKLGYQSLLFQQAALRGGESAPFLRAATVSYRGCLEQTLHYINPDRKGKKAEWERPRHYFSILIWRC